MKARSWFWAIVVAAFVLITRNTQAQVPQLINYQGQLTNSSGNPSNGTFTMVFRIFDVATAGTALYTETQTVTVSNGVFNVLIGSVTPVPLNLFDSGTERFLEVTVNGTALTPRRRFGSVPYAFRSPSSGASGWTDDGTTVRLTTITDRVGIGTTNPAANLDVAGTFRLGTAIYQDGTASGKAIISSNGVDTDLIPAKDDVGNVRIMDGNSQGGLALANGGTSQINSYFNVSTSTPSALLLQTNGGNVGIGTTDPEARLDVAGDGKIRGSLSTIGIGLPGSVGPNPVFVGSPGNYITFGHANTSEDFIGYKDNTFFFKDSPGGADDSDPAVVVGGPLSAAGIGLPDNFGYNPEFVGSPGNYISFGHANTSEDFIGYKDNTFYFKDSPGGEDNSDPKVEIGGGLGFPGNFGPDPNFVGSPGNYIAFGHAGISEDFIGYKDNTFYFKDSPGGGDNIDPTVVVGVLQITGGSDLAEPFAISESESLESGSVVIIDEANPGQLKLSEKAYDTRVAGIISGAGGVNPGLTLSQEDKLGKGHNVALNGRVYAKATAANGTIKPGDLLTTSDIPGYLMKATDRKRAYGTVLGKAMTGLEAGEGLVLVLVNLQ